MSVVRVCIPAEGDSSFSAYAHVKQRWSALERALARAIEEAKLGTLDGDDFGGGVYRIWFRADDPERLREWLRERSSVLRLPAGWTLE